MNISLHIETEKTEQPIVYTGEDTEEAKSLLSDALDDEVTVLQVNLQTKVNGEARALVRSGKGEAAADLLSDVLAWFEEVE